MRFRPLSAAIALTAFAVVLFTVSAAQADDSAPKATYIVQLLQQPAVAYDGGIPGLQETKPAQGTKIDPNSSSVQKYADYLRSKHDEALQKVGGSQKLYDYVYAVNGFSAELTQAQADKLAGSKDVLNVTEDEQNLLDTSTTPTFLGLSGSGGFWVTPGATGEDVVIGMIDGGVWPENPSFSDRTGTNPNGKSGKKSYQQIPGWHGKCTPGEAFNASMCNQKLIGAQAFFAARQASGLAIPDYEFLSPRDWGGHGTHTSSTAGGNFGVQPTGDAAGFTPTSGMAPRARISTYKVCFDNGAGQGTCFTSDSVAAIDQAVADGVDVMNYSISGSSTNFLDPVEVAFFNAAGAGVFVAASAGNAGTASAVAHPGPWLTTVAASTHNRTGRGSVTIDGVKYDGLSYAAAVTGTLVDAEDSGLPGIPVLSAQQCRTDVDMLPANGVTPTLDPTKIANKIVVCDRGGNALVDKSLAVRRAGGIGMVLTNAPTSANTLFALIHSVPAVHVPFTAPNYAAIHAAADAGKTATIAKFTADLTVPAPLIASFSSRGPLLAGGGDLLKPDVSAPGVDILASVAPPGNQGRDFDSYQGTSMSSPHVAGVGALLKELRPTWSPMMIKSALMTTGYDLLTGADPFSQGGGHIDPKKAADPGLVFDSGPVDWIKFLCGTKQLTGSLCTTFGSIDPSDLNLASIAIGDLAGSQVVNRTAKSVGSQSETYTFSVEGLTGITATPSAANFTIGPNGTQPWSVTFTRTTAALNAYATGFLKWTGNSGHVVRMPVAVRPLAILAPAEVTLNASNAATWSITSGVGPETITLGKRGLIPAATDAVTALADDPTDTFNTATPDANQGIFVKEIVVPAGTTVLRGATFDVDTDGNDDLDIYLYRTSGAPTGLVAASAGATSEEIVTLRNPIAGTYKLYVHAFETDGPDVNLTLFNWVLGTTDAGNMAVNGPFAATIGSTHTVNLTTVGLTAGTRYLGQITYSGSSSGLFTQTTIVSGKAS